MAGGRKAGEAGSPGGKPKVLPMRDILRHTLDYRREIIIRRTRFELAKAEARAHILEGLKKAIDQIDAVIAAGKSGKSWLPKWLTG